MMRRSFIILFLLQFLSTKSLGQDTFPSLLGVPSSKAVNQDYIYDKSIHTVQLYPMFGKFDDQIHQPIISLHAQPKLVLRFDELGEEASDFIAEIYHCNADWAISDIPAIEFLTEYNELNFNDFEFSVNTKVLYTHFFLVLPKVKVSGNYIVRVYKDGKKKKPAFVKRFIVYENVVNIGAARGAIAGSEAFLRNHQIDFNIYYPNVDLENPKQQVKVVLRQNFRWDNAITDLKPLFIKDLQKVLDYNYFDLSNNFKAGNEFRHFNFSSFRGQNFNVKEALDEDYIFVVNLYTETSNEAKVYNKMTQDHNGRFYIYTDMGDATISADYANVVFSLKSQSAENGDVYIIGSFNNWQLSDEGKMVYHESEQVYKAEILLKQGAYDYAFTVYNPDKKIRDDHKLEGSHNLTGNDYDIIVYYKTFGARGDRIIGYQKLK